VVKQGLESSSNRNLTKILWRVQMENSERITAFVIRLEDCEFRKKAAVASLQELGTSGLALTQSLRRLIKSFLPLLPTLTNTTDIRIIKNILLTWTNSVSDICEANELLTNRFPDLAADSHFGVRSNEALVRSSISSFQQAIALLQRLQEANRTARAAGEEKEDVRFLNVLVGLEKMLPDTVQATGDLDLCLQAIDEGTEELDTLVLCAKTFVHKMNKTIVVAKIIESDGWYPSDLGDHLNEMSSSTTFLASILLSSASPSDSNERLEKAPPKPSLATRAGLAHQKSVSHGVVH